MRVFVCVCVVVGGGCADKKQPRNANDKRVIRACLHRICPQHHAQNKSEYVRGLILGAPLGGTWVDVKTLECIAMLANTTRLRSNNRSKDPCLTQGALTTNECATVPTHCLALHCVGLHCLTVSCLALPHIALHGLTELTRLTELTGLSWLTELTELTGLIGRSELTELTELTGVTELNERTELTYRTHGAD